jgi:PhzF family phenazine biosynthesis protein
MQPPAPREEEECEEMELPFYQVDAFTERPFAGNPAGVVLLDRPLPEETQQAIAAENNLSETAFVVTSDERLPLRWFTPLAEIDLCGHATLATAFALFELEGWTQPELTFHSASGPLTVRRSERGLTMDFPARPAEPAPVPDGLIAALGEAPLEVRGARDLLLLYESEAQVARLAPNMEGLKAIDAFAFIATAAGGDVDFVSRFFAPGVGIPEDPVTGSAHCTLTPFWAERLGKRTLRARQISARGGELTCEMRGDRVLISGKAALYLKGTIRTR